MAILGNVKIDKAWLVPGYKGHERPTADGAMFQLIQVEVDTGIASAAVKETIGFVRTKPRPWVDCGLDHAWNDPSAPQAIRYGAIARSSEDAV